MHNNVLLYPVVCILPQIQGYFHILVQIFVDCKDNQFLQLRVFDNHAVEIGSFAILLCLVDRRFHNRVYCGVRSGRDVDKWKEAGLTPMRSDAVDAPCIAECPVNIECRVVRTEQLGSHDMFIAEVAAVHVDDRYMDGKGRFHLEDARPIVYSHGEYYDLGEKLGRFGYSVQKKP